MRRSFAAFTMLALAACIPTTAESRPNKPGIHKSKAFQHKARQTAQRARPRASRSRAAKGRAGRNIARVPTAAGCSDWQSERFGCGRGIGVNRGNNYPELPGITSSDSAVILPHPAGCPRVRFCGCGSSVEVFGRPVRDLYLARAWFRFPRASPAPGRAAVRVGHVFIIREVYGDGTVLAYDPNGGRRKTWLHRRSLAGFTVVDPTATASLN